MALQRSVSMRASLQQCSGACNRQDSGVGVCRCRRRRRCHLHVCIAARHQSCTIPLPSRSIPIMITHTAVWQLYAPAHRPHAAACTAQPQQQQHPLAPNPSPAAPAAPQSPAAAAAPAQSFYAACKPKRPQRSLRRAAGPWWARTRLRLTGGSRA